MGIWKPRQKRESQPGKPSAAELRAAIEEIERPKADLYEISDVPRWAEIYSKQGIHPGLWAFLAVPAASFAGRISWLRESPREEALERARVFTGSEDEKEVKRFARRNLRERRMQDEIFWRPWLAPRMKVEGLEHLDKARKRRGVILAGVQLGPVSHLQLRIALHLQKEEKTLYIARPVKIEDERRQTGPRAHYTPSMVERLEAAGARFVGGEDTDPVLRELLKRREVCWIPVDTAAPRDGRVVPLAGRRTRLSPVIATLSRETNSPALPVAALRWLWKPRGQIGKPLQPRNFAGDDELHDKLVEIAGATILERRHQVTPELVAAIESGKPSP